MLKKIFSSIVAVSFFVNTISYADVLSLKNRSSVSSNTLAPESRLEPISNPALLDVMKLAAVAIQQQSEDGIRDREKATSSILPPAQPPTASSTEKAKESTFNAIDKVTSETAPKELTRPGDEIVFDYRHKVVIGDTEFIPCRIKGIQYGDTVITIRNYLCCAKRGTQEKYELEFVPTKSVDLKGQDVSGALKDQELLMALAKKSRQDDVKAGIVRYALQQGVDKYIADVITGKIDSVKATRLSANDALIAEVYEFLSKNGFKAANLFLGLVQLGQVMIIPGLALPHAGGMGIYLPDKSEYQNVKTLLHEIFAKCGLSHTEADEMIKLFSETKRGTLISTTVSESGLLEKARKADFAGRWDDVLNIDFYKDGFQVPVDELRGPDGKWYLGIDSSTKSVKFFVIERIGDTQRLIWTHTESFNDAHYRDTFGAVDGVLPHPQAPEQYHTDPLMIADALDRGMAQLSDQFKANGLLLSKLKSIAGAGQQHGTVYLNKNAENLNSIPREDPLWMALQDADVLANPTSPIWQDGSTAEEVREIHKAAGGEQAVRAMTGSKGTLRFSLPQAMAIFKRHPSALRNTKTILNIAGWNGALLTGNDRFPWDPGDALGTNAVKAREKAWWINLMNELIPGLGDKFSPIRPSDYIVGLISSYWVDKYGFSRDTEIVNFTGDNPSGMAGMGVISEGQVVISLGTSYTMYTFVGSKGLDQALETPIGHIFGETLVGEYMNLVCFQNGDDTLDMVRTKHISAEEALNRATKKGIEIPTDKEEKNKLIKRMRIEIFTEELDKTEAGNAGAMMIAMHKTEDVVRISYNSSTPFTRNLDESNRPQVFRAAVEGQAYFMKWVADQIGLNIKDIRLTGGVSNNIAVRKIFADVFNARVNVLKEGSEAVATGSAIRALMANLKLSPEEAIKGLTEIDQDKVATPDVNNVAVYKEYYGDFEKLLGEAIFSGRISDAMDFHTKAFDGKKPQAMAVAPGRINILGEHTDYAGGQVLPIALDGVDVIATASKREDGKIVIYSPRFERYEIDVEALKAIPAGQKEGLKAIPEEHGWARYPLGVIRQLMERPGVTITGLSITYDGNVPLGGGLSSSAAVEAAIFTALEGILKTGLNKKDASVLCQKAEHWRGNICGIMDQFASFNGERGKAILLNCNTLVSKTVDISFLDTAGYAIVAVDTGLPKTDEAWQKYMARKADLEQAIAKFLGAKFHQIRTILDIAPNLTPEEFESIGTELRAVTNDQIYNRVKHVVYEEARVKKLIVIAAEANALAKAIRNGDKSKCSLLDEKVKEFGAVISEGHKSLDELYEMSSPYLNQLVESAKEHRSVGSRFTGAGIVGCTVNIVRKEDLGAFREGVVSEYRSAFEDKPIPKITVSRAGPGARAIDLSKVTVEIKDALPAAEAVSTAAKNKVFPNQPVITVVGSIVADVIVPLGKGSDYPMPAKDSGLIAEGDKAFRTPPASATKAYLDSLTPRQRERLAVTYGGPACASAFGMYELGAKVRLVCAVGDDELGKDLITLMKSKGMDTSGIRVIPNVATSTNLIFSNKDTGDTAYNLALEGANEYLLEEHIKDEDLEGVAALHLGGIALNPKLMDRLEVLIERAKRHGVRIGWDTVVDLYGKEKEAAPLMGKVDYMTPSMKEAVNISGKGSVGENLKFFMALGVPAVFLKNGENGSEIFTSKSSVFGVETEVHMPSARVVGYEDSTGAGDSYSGFITCAVASGWNPLDAAKGASVCGALTCERRGGASIVETPMEAFNRKKASFETDIENLATQQSEYNVVDTGVSIRGANVLTLERKLPQGVKSAVPEIVSVTVAPNAGMNLISLKVLFPGQSEPTEVLATASPEELAEYFAEGPDNPHGKNPFTKAGAVIGPIPNRAVGEVVGDKVKVTFPNGHVIWVPANHEGSTVPLYHLHGFFHRLEQNVSSWFGKDKGAIVEGSVDVKGKSEEWPWPADSNITVRRAVTSDNKARLTVTQTNTGTEKTWASWVDHSYFKQPPGIGRDDVRLRLPAQAMTVVGTTAEGKPDYKNCLPTGEIKDVTGTSYDFTAPEGRPLGKLFLDDNFTSLIKQPDGSVIVEVLYPELGYKLRIRAYDKLTRKDGTVEIGKLRSVQVYSPDTSDFICVEIGAHLNNPFDEKTWGDRDTGMVELNPGDTYEYNYEVEYVPIEDEIAQRITDLTPFSEEELNAITRKSSIEEMPTNARRLAASYLEPASRALALKAVRSLRENGRREFVESVIKEFFNILNRKARPALPNLPADKIELATFGLYEPGDFEAFVKSGEAGLLLETVVNFRAAIEDSNDPSGHTGKTLINLPWQVLPEHRHVDMVVLAKGSPIPANWMDASTINGFTGILEYNPDGSKTGKILYSINDYTIAVANSHESVLPGKRIAYFPGKSETFNFISGKAILFGNRSRMVEVGKVKGLLREVPPELREIAESYKRKNGITAPDMMYVEPGAQALLKKNTLHALLALDEGVVYEEYSTPSRDEADLFTNSRIVRQSESDSGALSRFPAGIDETVIDLAAADVRNNKAVIFVSQDFATSERCRELMSVFPNATFVSINQHTQLKDLPAMLSDNRYAGCKKVLVTLGLKADQIQSILNGNEKAFEDVMPLNISAELIGALRGGQQRSFQKGVLAMGLLAAGIPKDAEYRQSHSYMVLKALLTMIFNNADDAEQYITNLVNPQGSIDVVARFGYLIGKIIGPVQRLVINEFTRIVNIFA